MGEWKKFFPLPRPRDEQARALDKATALVDSGEKFIIAELGTGVGKSAFAICLANYIRSKGVDGEYKPGAYVLTSQKTLQDQYIKDFPGNASDLRSSSNFKCTKGPGENCGQTQRYNAFTKREAKGSNTCEGCPYRAAKDAFMKAPVGVTNYSYFLSETVYAGSLEPRELLVLDEAHNVEKEMRGWALFSVDEQLATDIGAEFPFGAPKLASLHWLVEHYKPLVVAAMMKAADKVDQAEKKGVKRGISTLIERMDFLDKHVCGLNRIFDGGPANQDAAGSKNYLVNWDEDKNGKRTLRIQPLDAGPLANDLLYPFGKHVLLMSATILDKDTFMRSCGLKNADLIIEPTPFPPKNFGITYRPVGRMSKRYIGITLPKMVRAVKEILKVNVNEKGIIHCASYEIARALANIKDPRLLVQLSGRDREEILKRHMTSKEPTVIVSPSMMEGLDLEGDLGRFQIICKVPFPNMGDPVVEQKMNTDESWYAWCTARSLIQSVGRCVRNSTDWTRTYILDESFGDFAARWYSFFPEYFSEMEVITG